MGTLLSTDIWQLAGNVSIIGYVIVMIALSFLWLIYAMIPKLLNQYTKWELKRQGKKECAESDTLGLSADELAAISSALYMYLSELHDYESGMITIKKVSRTYSPWSSKIYSMNKYNNNKL